ncbi:MAG TPA: 50S ribosomal protein L6 [Candidatus Paceibacterota bacterium]
MSRIGKRLIEIPEKTEVKVSENVLIVSGPLGELRRNLHPDIEIRVTDNIVAVIPKKESPVWGTYSSHLSNMVEGVNKPFEKKLILEGVGFKSEVAGEKIKLALGFSHPVEVLIPAHLKVSAEKNVITISGADKEAVGSFAAKLRSMKKPEPYKGKGFRYDTEVIKRKQGKKSV